MGRRLIPPNPMNPPRVSIIISNFNGLRYLPKLLESLRGQRGVEMEIIVVDRQSRDGSVDFLASQPDVKVVSFPPEHGLVAGYRAGVPSATADLYFFANEDMWFDPDCMRLLADKINLETRVGAADPWQWNYDGSKLLHAGMRFKKSRWTANSPHPRRENDFFADLPDGAEIPFPCAAGVMVHRALYEDVGGWDPEFYLDWEDADLWSRAWQRGWKAVTAPAARDYHAVGASNTQTIDAGRDVVSRKRYVSNRASIGIIALKTFSWRALPLALVGWLSAPVANALKGRWRRVALDFEAAAELIRRAPAALHFRKAYGPYICRRPGERFFTAPEFNG
jgi:GT2 family glycosyltransferase